MLPVRMERLIESVRKFPCLWKTESHEYKLYENKKVAWEKVAKECGTDVPEVKSLWRKLRDSHRQAVGRKKAIGHPSISKSWKYENQMAFLLPIMKIRPKTSDVVAREETNDQKYDPLECSYVIEHSGNEPICPKIETVSSLLEKKRKLRQMRLARRNPRERRILIAANTTKNSLHDSALGKFFMSMLLTTNELPEHLQINVQRQIFDTVMEAKAESLQHQSSRSSASPPAVDE